MVIDVADVVLLNILGKIFTTSKSVAILFYRGTDFAPLTCHLSSPWFGLTHASGFVTSLKHWPFSISGPNCIELRMNALVLLVRAETGLTSFRVYMKTACITFLQCKTVQNIGADTHFSRVSVDRKTSISLRIRGCRTDSNVFFLCSIL